MIQLLKGCRNYDRKAQREMVDHLSPYLYTICLRYADESHGAQDLLQEALILIFNNISDFRAKEENAFKSWCKRIAINNALGKKRKRSLDLDKSTDETEVFQPVSPSVNSRLNVEDIMNLLNYLPENQRAVFNLSVMDGYSHREIAQTLQIAESSSRTLLVRARNFLQEAIKSTEKIE